METGRPLNIEASNMNSSDACEICGTNRTLDRHHVVSRGMGGSKNPELHSDENLMTLCRHCHRNIHEGGWVLERGIRITSCDRRQHRPRGHAEVQYSGFRLRFVFCVA